MGSGNGEEFDTPDYRCPECRSNRTKKLSLVYKTGASDIELMTAGMDSHGDLGGAVSWGTSTTRLAQSAAPPTSKSLGSGYAVWVAWATILTGGYYFFAGAWDLHASPLGVILWGFAVFGPLPFLLAKNKDYNEHIWKPAYERWRSSYICLRCGAKFIPDELDDTSDFLPSEKVEAVRAAARERFKDTPFTLDPGNSYVDDGGDPIGEYREETDPWRCPNQDEPDTNFAKGEWSDFVEPDRDLAIAYYDDAAKQGHLEAQRNLTIAYFYGDYEPGKWRNFKKEAEDNFSDPDFDYAIEWAVKTAAKGDLFAIILLHVMTNGMYIEYLDEDAPYATFSPPEGKDEDSAKRHAWFEADSLHLELDKMRTARCRLERERHIHMPELWKVWDEHPRFYPKHKLRSYFNDLRQVNKLIDEHLHAQHIVPIDPKTVDKQWAKLVTLYNMYADAVKSFLSFYSAVLPPETIVNKDAIVVASPVASQEPQAEMATPAEIVQIVPATTQEIIPAPQITSLVKPVHGQIQPAHERPPQALGLRKTATIALGIMLVIGAGVWWALHHHSVGRGNHNNNTLRELLRSKMEDKGLEPSEDFVELSADSQSAMVIGKGRCKSNGRGRCEQLFIAVGERVIGTDTYYPSWGIDDIKVMNTGAFRVTYHGSPAKPSPTTVTYVWNGKSIKMKGASPPTRKP